VVSLQAQKAPTRRTPLFLSNTFTIYHTISAAHLQALVIHTVHLIRIRDKHNVLTIDILVATLNHAHFARRQLPTLRLERIDLGRRDAAHVLGKVLVPRHDDLAVDVDSRVRVSDGALGFAEHLSRHESQLVWTREKHVEGGLEFEDGFENTAPTENVQTQARAGQRDGQAAYVA
jgi:hypothetical protein